MSNRSFQVSGQSEEQIFEALDSGRQGDFAWNDLHNLKAAYFAGEEVVRVAKRAFDLYMSDNAIYAATLYPSLPRIEAEVVAMVQEMLNAPAGAGGMVTTGGTESIMLAVKAARDWARVEKPQVKNPKLLLADSAHPAFVKAAVLLGLAVTRAPETASYRADASVMRALVDEDTVMIVGSAPPYPLGLVDPIEDIGAIAVEHNLWMHVDSCIGGFVLPFAEDLGEPVPRFDFRVPGVTSMSADLHKYGYANRGSSTLLLRDASLLEHQRFTNGDWPGGIYSTLGVAGSRASGPVVSAWAVMKLLGFDGYRERVRGIIEAKRCFAAAIAEVDEVAVIGAPEGGNISVFSTTLDMHAVAEGLVERGWGLGRLQRPPGLILLLNYRHGEVAGEFGTDLKQVVADVRAGRRESSGGGAVYVA